MPRMDGTGPMGMGAMTGRRQGRCAGSAQAGQERGAGLGPGRGPGRCGFQGAGRQRWMRNQEPVQEKETLTRAVGALESRLAAIKQRLGAIESEAK